MGKKECRFHHKSCINQSQFHKIQISDGDQCKQNNAKQRSNWKVLKQPVQGKTTR